MKFKRILARTLAALAGVVILLLAVSWWVGAAVGVDQPPVRPSVEEPRPSPLRSAPPLSADETTQILFGDLHVHTDYSLDAAIFNTPALKDLGYKTPADACDFARYCSALDFWSINDHAEGLAPWQWQETKQAIRQCNAATDPQSPDMVSFLGWEWSHQDRFDPAEHYGHKNVVFLDTDESRVPARPIASGENSTWRRIGTFPAPLRGLALLWFSGFDMEEFQNLAHHLQSISETPDCQRAEQADVRELPPDCYEWASSPRGLFGKLDQWGYEALVIPHGLAWGTTNPMGADFRYQLAQHDERYQRLLEVYSNHGSSEVYRDLALAGPGDATCPQATNDSTPCCRQAGEIIRRRCESNGGADCDARAEHARSLYMEALNGGNRNPHAVVPATHPDDWGQCDQLADSFQPAHNYRPKQSAQYLLTLGDESKRFRPGFIGSSDSHTASAGTGYKEFERLLMTDSKDVGTPLSPGNPAADRPQPAGQGAAFDLEDGSNAFYYTGGLVAVHSRGRTREAIWEALKNRAVYGTSGPRIGLWFDLLEDNGVRHLMGSRVRVEGVPRFRVAATGSFKQKPGCPDFVEQRLGTEQMQRLCRNECYHPGDEVHRVERIEVVRVLPQIAPDEEPAELIQDPWRVIECPASQAQCIAEFSDPELPRLQREAVYYVRAIQEPTQAIQGDPFRCERDAQGNCIKTNYCVGVPPEEDCMSPTRHRAWSSPIYVHPGAE